MSQILVRTCLMLLFCLMASVVALGADDPSSRASLAGVGSVRVVVEHFSNDALPLGLDRDAIKAAAELRLRRSGIKVSDASSPYLYLNINLVPVLNGKFVAYSAQVALHQRAQLIANQEVQFVATWTQSCTGGVGRQNVREVRGFVDDMVDAFINDYLAANQ